MGWFSNAKKDDIYEANIPEDKSQPTQLRGKHPVIIDSVDGDKAKVIGCTSKEHQAIKYNCPEVKTVNNKLEKTTYARSDQGLREITESDVVKNKQDKVSNGDEIRRNLRK